MGSLVAWIRNHARDGLLSWAQQHEAATRFNTSVAVVERRALQNHILPLRYARQQQLVSCAEQLKLFSSQVVVIGCGGLGGHVVLGLARLGVGQIRVVDDDVFEEHNLNRQSLATLADLGRRKVDVAVECVARINPAVRVVPCCQHFDSLFERQHLQEAHVVVDALDNIPARLELAAQCRALGKPLVHGAIRDWFGQVAFVGPADALMEQVYSEDRAVTGSVNTLSFVPAVVAGLQVAEICKVLLNKGQLMDKGVLSLDLLDMEFLELRLDAAL